MKTFTYSLILLLLLTGCSTPTPVLPETPEYAFYSDTLVSELWFILDSFPNKVSELRTNTGEPLPVIPWKSFNDRLAALPGTPDQLRALQVQAITTTLAQYKK